MRKILLAQLVAFPLLGWSQSFNYSGITPIPDNGPQACVTITVSGLPTTINSSFGLSGVCFDITHTYDNDLQLRLISPNGNSIFIASNIGAEFDNFTNTCLAENGTNGFLAQGTAPFTGIYIPLESLNQLNNGQDPNGVWSFCAQDFADIDTGSIHSVTLVFSANPPVDPAGPPKLCTFCTCPGGAADCDLLPDMTSSAQSILKDIDVNHHSTFEQPGNINFDNATPNIGWGPLEIKGVDTCYCGTTIVPCTATICPNGDPVKQVVHQIIYSRQNNSDTLLVSERTAGFMSYHPSHGHIHVDHWADFTLRTSTANPDATTWPIVGVGTKQSFCLINLGDCDANNGYCQDANGNVLHKSDIPNADFGFVSGCGLEQGIYTGNLDIYVVGLNMGIDLTGVCNGDYYIVSITDPENNMLETDETNNWVAVPVTLTEQTPSPSADFSQIFSGVTVALQAQNLTNATSFEWNFGDGITDTQNNPTLHQYTANGTYYITFTVISPCGTFVHTDSVTVTTVGVAENNIPNDYFLNAQPNPAKGQTELSYFALKNNEQITIEMYNAVGQKTSTLLNEQVTNGRHALTLNFKELGLKSGMYFVKLTNEQKSITLKIMNAN